MAGIFPHASSHNILYDNYKDILMCDIVNKQSLTVENINAFEILLNKAQPQDNEMIIMRDAIQFLYRKNPSNFINFLVRSRLSHFILWTESKCIVRHFNLHGILYIKWVNSRYECSLHNGNTNGTERFSDNNYQNKNYSIHQEDGRGYFNGGKGNNRGNSSGKGRGNGGKGRGNGGKGNRDDRRIPQVKIMQSCHTQNQDTPCNSANPSDVDTTSE